MFGPRTGVVEREARLTSGVRAVETGSSAGSRAEWAGKGNAAARVYGGVEGAVDLMVEARRRLARVERDDLAALEGAAQAGDEVAVARARVAMGWQLSVARQCLRDAAATAVGENASWVREEAERIRGAIAVIEERADGVAVDAEGLACAETAWLGSGGGIGIGHRVAGDGPELDATAAPMAALEAAAREEDPGRVERARWAMERALLVGAAELAAAETAAYALPVEERAAALARVVAARSVQSVRQARANQIVNERATSERATLTLSRDHIQFPDTEVGLESEAEPLWIRNDGIRPVSIDRVKSPDGFPVAGECEAPLEAGQVIRVDVGFRPEEIGRASGTLRIETDGGFRSASAKVRGRGIEPTPATRDKERVARAMTEARGVEPVPAPRTFSAMRDLLRSAQELDGVGDRDGARRAVEAVNDSLREVANPARASEVFSQFGFGHQAAELSRGMAVQAARDLAMTLVSRREVAWAWKLAEFECGREAIELLTGEASDSATFRAMHRGGKLTVGILGGAMAGLAAAPLLAGEAGLLGHAAAGGLRSSWLWGVANPGTATAVAAAGTGVAIDMADKGGPAAWLESARTFEGMLGLAFDALQVYEAHLTTRAPAPRPDAAEDRAQTSPHFAQSDIERLQELKRVDDAKRIAESLANDQRFARRKTENRELLADKTRLGADLEKAGVSAERLGTALEGDPGQGGERLPLAFADGSQFDQFKDEFATLISGIEVRGRPITAAARNIGSATSFYSGNPKKPLGHHWDRTGPGKGDVDIELNSPELVLHMLRERTALNPDVLVGGEKVIFKNQLDVGTGFHEAFPAVRAFCKRWSVILGRDVDVKLKADATPISEIPTSADGPIEIFRKEQDR